MSGGSAAVGHQAFMSVKDRFGEAYERIGGYSMSALAKIPSDGDCRVKESHEHRWKNVCMTRKLATLLPLEGSAQKT